MRRSRSRSPPSKRRKVSSRSRSRSRSPHRSRSRSRSRDRASSYRRREAREPTSSRRSRSRSRGRSPDRYSRSQQQSQQRGSNVDESQQRRVRFSEDATKNPLKEEIANKNDSDDEDEEFRRRVETELKQRELEEKRVAEAAEKRRQLMEKLKMEQEQARQKQMEAAKEVTAAPSARPAATTQQTSVKTTASSIDLFGDSIKPEPGFSGYKAAPLTPMPETAPAATSVNRKPQQPLISGIGGAKVAIDLFDMKFEVETDTSASGVAADRKELGMVMAEVDPSDDTQGYYAFRIGEILFKKYQVTGFHGQGVFSSVLKAVDVETKKEVAIKLLRNNDHMKRTGRKEMKILKSLTESDPDDKFHIVRYFGSFEDRDHLCLVLEPMDMNLRQVLKKYGADVGLNHQAIRVYAFKLIKALVLLKKNNIVHADIKPDNVLVNADRTLVKLGDLGSAFETSEAEVVTELVSRFYRAPEIILGMLPTPAIDMWSLGTTLYELATGRFMIQSKNNNHHLKLIMNLKGPFPKKMIQQCSLKDEYFDEEGYFLEEYVDPVSGHTSIHRVQTPSKPTRSITKELLASFGLTSTRGSEEEKKLVTNLGDLIEQCTALDPRKRITPEQALKHPLF